MSSREQANSRNYGFWNRAEQKAIEHGHVALGGAGGDGFQLGVKLAMMGVGSFNVADPEVFTEDNSNRVFGASSSNIGRNKAEVFAETIQGIRPDVKVKVFTEGVTPDNVEEFMADATLSIDETELTYPHVGAAIAREARRREIPNMFVMNIGFAGVATAFDERGRSTFEEMMGIPKGAPLDEIADMKIDFSRCLAYIPQYGDLETLLAVQRGKSLPSISPGVDAASAIGSSEAFLHLTRDVSNKRRRPTWAPRFRYMDAYNSRAGIVRNARVGYWVGTRLMAIRSRLGLNPKAEYRDTIYD